MKTTISNTINEIAGDIVAYLGFLREQGYFLSLCRMDPVFAPCMDAFLPYGGHAFEHCMRVKACRKAECDRRQEELKNRVTKERFGPFECFAGVTEYVFPIEYEGGRSGIVCLSGYRATERKDNRASMQFISDNLEKQFTLNELCENIGYSQTYVSREFKKRKGKSVFDYVIDLRLETAKKLLLVTDLSVTAIAGQVGFSGSNYFTSVFKDRMGCTPREMRKRAKENG